MDEWTAAATRWRHDRRAEVATIRDTQENRWHATRHADLPLEPHERSCDFFDGLVDADVLLLQFEHLQTLKIELVDKLVVLEFDRVRLGDELDDLPALHRLRGVVHGQR